MVKSTDSMATFMHQIIKNGLIKVAKVLLKLPSFWGIRGHADFKISTADID